MQLIPVKVVRCQWSVLHQTRKNVCSIFPCYRNNSLPVSSDQHNVLRHLPAQWPAPQKVPNLKAQEKSGWLYIPDPWTAWVCSRLLHWWNAFIKKIPVLCQCFFHEPIECFVDEATGKISCFFKRPDTWSDQFTSFVEEQFITIEDRCMLKHFGQEKPSDRRLTCSIWACNNVQRRHTNLSSVWTFCGRQRPHQRWDHGR